MSKYTKPISATSSMKPDTNSHDINKSLQTEEHHTKKQLQRKPSNTTLNANRSRNVSKQTYNPLESPRYMIATPLKLIPIVQSITNQGEMHGTFIQDLKTQRKDVTIQKSGEKSGRQKRYNQDSADYYKYWKKKANQYQEMNFNLHRLNSQLQQENQILKHKMQKMQRKLIKLYQPEPTKVVDNSQNYEKLESYYRAKVDHLSKIISQQQLLIEKKDKKIKQLSKYISQNYQLKNLLDNMQQKISEMRSVGSKQDSRAGSIQKNSQKGKQTYRKYTDRLAVDYQTPLLNTRSNYTIRDKKKLSGGFQDDNRSFTGRGY